MKPKQIDITRVDEIITELDLWLDSDTKMLDGVIQTTIANNQKAVEDFKNGKQQAVGVLIGTVMRVAKNADAKTVRQLIIKTLQNN